MKSDKDLFKRAYEEMVNHPEYVNKTYSGKDFQQKINHLVSAWMHFIFEATDEVKRYEDKNSLDYKLMKWCHWLHNHHKMFFYMDQEKYGYKYPIPEFLECLASQTLDFINAQTEEEESKVFDTSYCIDYLNGVYDNSKYIWLTEDKLETKSKLLPLYAPYDLSRYIRGEKLNKLYRKKLANICDVDKIIKESDELWRLFKIAVEKGILIDNYGKDVIYE